MAVADPGAECSNNCGYRCISVRLVMLRRLLVHLHPQLLLLLFLPQLSNAEAAHNRRTGNAERQQKTYLIRFIEQTQAMAHPQRINVIRLAALAELVRLDVLQADNLLRHDASVPVPADALLSYSGRKS